jgi:hypothetical protein
VDEARRDGWLGFQITAPHKQRVMGLLDEVEPDARRIGAANSVAADADGRLVGFNTDVLGFLAGLRSCHLGELSGGSVVVAGSGGVGHAVAYGLATARVGTLTLLDLDVAMPRRLAEVARSGRGCRPAPPVRHRVRRRLHPGRDRTGAAGPRPRHARRERRPHARCAGGDGVGLQVGAHELLDVGAAGRGLQRILDGIEVLIERRANQHLEPDPTRSDQPAGRTPA